MTSPMTPERQIPSPAEREKLEIEVRKEYEKFIEKRDALRETTGKLRRSRLAALMPGAEPQLS